MGLVDSLFGGGGSDDMGKALAAIQNVPLPVLKEYYPELYQQVVSLNPELETAVDLGPSEMAGVSTDPGLRQKQLGALNKLSEIGDAGGRDAQFLANQARLESDINTNLQGQQGAIEQDLATRGLSGGMTELVSKNINAQGAANRQAQMAMEAKAQAEQRALDAILNGGQMAGQMQAQDFSQASAKAKAADDIARFNAQNRQQVISNNVGAKNNAQAWNAQTAQQVAGQNVDTKNQQQQYNLGLAQQRYDNELRRATGVADMQTRLADSKNANRATEMGFVGNLIGAGATAYAGKK